MKQVKGYVESSLIERFRKGEINFLTISCLRGSGFENPVTLSPVAEPNHKAMWKGIKKFLSKKEDMSSRWFWSDTMKELKRLEAKHTPKPGTEKPNET